MAKNYQMVVKGEARSKLKAYNDNFDYFQKYQKAMVMVEMLQKHIERVESTNVSY